MDVIGECIVKIDMLMSVGMQIVINKLLMGECHQFE